MSDEWILPFLISLEKLFKRNRRLYAVVIHSLDEVNAQNEKRETEQPGGNVKSADSEQYIFG